MSGVGAMFGNVAFTAVLLLLFVGVLRAPRKSRRLNRITQHFRVVFRASLLISRGLSDDRPSRASGGVGM